jgi:pimeloyl-ACP methyl ester carboxylesterase
LPQAATLSKGLAFLIIVSGMADTAAHQMDYLTTVSLKKFGFSQEAVRDMLMARHAVNEYFRGHLPRDAAERIVQSARSQPWFPLAYVPSVLPEDVSKTKWIRQMDFNPAPLWKEVTVPVLILYGEDDDQVPSAAEAALLKTDLEKAGNRSIAVKGFPRTSHELLVVSHDDQPWEWRHVPPEYPAVLVNWILKGRLP